MPQETILKSNKIFKYIPLSYPICLLSELGCNGKKVLLPSPSRSSPLPIYVLLFSSIIRDRTIQQRQSPWKRCWKIDFTSFKTILRLSQIALLLEGREFLEVRGGTAPEFRQRWYNLSPCCFRSQVQGCARNAKRLTKKHDARAELLVCSLNPLLFWRSLCRRLVIS